MIYEYQWIYYLLYVVDLNQQRKYSYIIERELFMLRLDFIGLLRLNTCEEKKGKDSFFKWTYNQIWNLRQTTDQTTYIEQW